VQLKKLKPFKKSNAVIEIMPNECHGTHKYTMRDRKCPSGRRFAPECVLHCTVLYACVRVGLLFQTPKTKYREGGP